MARGRHRRSGVTQGERAERARAATPPPPLFRGACTGGHHRRRRRRCRYRHGKASGVGRAFSSRGHAVTAATPSVSRRRAAAGCCGASRPRGRQRFVEHLWVHGRHIWRGADRGLHQRASLAAASELVGCDRHVCERRARWPAARLAAGLWRRGHRLQGDRRPFRGRLGRRRGRHAAQSHQQRHNGPLDRAPNCGSHRRNGRSRGSRLRQRGGCGASRDAAAAAQPTAKSTAAESEHTA